MPRAIRVLRANEPHGPLSDTLILAYDARRGEHAEVVSNQGIAIAIDLPPPVALRTDDVLLLDTGEFVEVVAAAEPLLEVRGDVHTLARLAWALGDRHVPVQIFSNRIRLRPGAAHQALIASLGGKAVAIEAPFDPEGGAYVVGDGHGHNHHHDNHSHDHDHHGDHHDHHHSGGAHGRERR